MYDPFDLRDDKSRAQSEIAFPDLVFIREWLKRNAPKDMPGITFHDANIDVSIGNSMGQAGFDRFNAQVTFKAGRLQDLASKFIPYAESLGMKATFNNDEIKFSIPSDKSLEIMKTLLERDPTEGRALMLKVAHDTSKATDGNFEKGYLRSSVPAYDSEPSYFTYTPDKYIKRMQAASGMDLIGEAGFKLNGVRVSDYMTLIDAWLKKHVPECHERPALNASLLELDDRTSAWIKFEVPCEQMPYERWRAILELGQDTLGLTSCGYYVKDSHAHIHTNAYSENLPEIVAKLREEFPTVAQALDKRNAERAEGLGG